MLILKLLLFVGKVQEEAEEEDENSLNLEEKDTNLDDEFEESYDKITLYSYLKQS